VIELPLNISLEAGKERTQRFVIGSDGLWDVMDNFAVGQAAARQIIDEDTNWTENVSPKEAAAKILEKCLEAGGNRDDVTICVVDVSFKSSS